MKAVDRKSVRMRPEKLTCAVTVWIPQRHKDIYDKLRDKADVDSKEEIRQSILEKLEALNNAFFDPPAA